MIQEVDQFPLVLKDAAAYLIGAAAAEDAFAAWCQFDEAILEAATSAAHQMGLAREALAIDLWRLGRCESSGSSTRALITAIQLGEATIARGLFAKAAQAGELHADHRLEMAQLEVSLGQGAAALEILREIQVRSYGWQIVWAQALMMVGAADAGDMVSVALAIDAPSRRGRGVHLLLEVAKRSRIFEDNAWLVQQVLEQCTAANLPHLLAVLVEVKCLADIPDSVIERLAVDETERMFWLAALRGARTGEIRETAKALNSVYSRHGLGGIFFAGREGNALGRIVSTPSTSGRASDALVSVVICAHDAEKTISYALSSIASQTHENLEIIVLDDHSSRPLKLSRDWLKGRPVTLHRNHINMGPYNSRNAGIELSKGEFIAFHDADDWAHPDKIAHQLDEMKKNAAVAHYGAHVRLKPSGIMQPENSGLFIGDGPITGIFHRSVFQSCGKFADTRTRGDIEFRRRLESPAKRQKVISLAVPYVLALDWLSNSRKMTDTLNKRIAMNDFLARSARISRMLSFSATPERAERIYVRTMNGYSEKHYPE